MKIRYLITAIMLYVVCSITVYGSVLSRIFNGHSIFSSDPSLSWFGSWQAFGLLLLLSLFYVFATAVIFGACSAEAICNLMPKLKKKMANLLNSGIRLAKLSNKTYSNLKPQQKKRINHFLIGMYRFVWYSRRNRRDQLSKCVKAVGQAFPSLVNK